MLNVEVFWRLGHHYRNHDQSADNADKRRVRDNREGLLEAEFPAEKAHGEHENACYDRADYRWTGRAAYVGETSGELASVRHHLLHLLGGHILRGTALLQALAHNPVPPNPLAHEKNGAQRHNHDEQNGHNPARAPPMSANVSRGLAKTPTTRATAVLGLVDSSAW